ncbi:hypothetical protein LXL04_008905 [Taraxacum kok-saghyz]
MIKSTNYLIVTRDDPGLELNSQNVSDLSTESMGSSNSGCGSAFSNKRYKIRVAGFDVKVVRIFGPVMYDMIVQMDFANTSIVQIDHVVMLSYIT